MLMLEPTVGLSSNEAIALEGSNIVFQKCSVFTIVNVKVAFKNTFIYPGDKHPVAVVITPKRFSNVILQGLRWKSYTRNVFRIVNRWPVAVNPGTARLVLYYKDQKIRSITLSVTKRKPINTTKEN